MSAMVSQITSVSIVYLTVYSGADQTKHQSSASLVPVEEIQMWSGEFPHKGPVTRKAFPFDNDIISAISCCSGNYLYDALKKSMLIIYRLQA